MRAALRSVSVSFLVGFAALIALAPSVVAQEKGALEPLLGRDNLWQMTRQDFVKEAQPLGFHWVSNAQDTAQTIVKETTLFGIPVYQTIVRFSGEKLKEVTVLFYNRGDAGTLPKEAFEALLKKASEGVTTFTKVKPVARGKDATNAVKAEGVEWEAGKVTALLEYSATMENKVARTPYRAEFIRLTLRPTEKLNLVAASLAARDKLHFSGKAHVKTTATGDVLIEGIPMVDQGQKGYCVVASAERVMRYYGGQIDAHELAEIANTSASGGTSVNAMLDSLKKLSNRLRIRVRTIEPFDVREVQALVADYNRAAKRGKRKEITLSGNVIDVQKIYDQMDKDVLREARTKNPSDLSRFRRYVQSHIDLGLPLLWPVMLGLVEETPKLPQLRGGHMRLIVGYNTKTSEILYSDSWGASHELKRMAAADAWTITSGLYTIEPITQ